MLGQALKNIRVMRAFALASFQADLEYRANFVTRVMTDIFWYLAQIMTFEVLFVHTPRIGSWDHLQTRVFLGVLFVTDAIYMILFSDNLDRINDKVRRGELDLLLAKPVNARFFISCQRLATASIGNLFIAVGWLVWAIASLPEFNWHRILWLLILLPTGVLILYCVRFMCATLAIILTRAEAVQYIWYNLYKFGMRPDSIYAPWMRLMLFTVFPVAVITSLPTRALLDPPDLAMFAYALGLTVFFMWISNRFWHFALKRYTSASS